MELRTKNPRSLDEEAAVLVAAIDPADVLAIIEKFPVAEKICIRQNWRDIDPYLAQRVPKVSADRAEYLTRKIEQYETELQRDVAEYARLRENGLAALSVYDLCISSGNDPLSALRTALRLKDAHISYDLSILLKLSLDLDEVQIDLTKAESPQLSLF